MEQTETAQAVLDSKRGAERLTLSLGSARMLGSISRPNLSFEYILTDVSATGSGILIPPDGPEPDIFQKGALIHMHLPFRFGEKFRDVGEIVRSHQRPEGFFFGVNLVGRVPLQYPVFLEYNQSESGARFQTTTADYSRLFRKVLKDAYFLKRGILIYLDHLIPVFGRSAHVRRRFSATEAGQHFKETRVVLDRSLGELEKYLEKANTPDFDAKNLPPDWDWDVLRKSVTVDFVLENMASKFKTREAYPYLRSIRLLDHRLYTNFNSLIAIHFIG
jgi:hypothetical protein